MALHIFEPDYVVWRLSDGAIGDVLARTALYARIRVRGTFPEVLEVEQGDPAWFVDPAATWAALPRGRVPRTEQDGKTLMARLKSALR